MLLRPRKFAYKNIQKHRRVRKAIHPDLKYGYIGLLLVQPLRLHHDQIFRYRLFWKRSAKRKDKTLRVAWVKFFPHLPVTKKVLGSRMGKGVGKLACWSAEVPAGVFIIELKNLRFGRARYFLRQFQHRLISETLIKSNSIRLVPTPLKWHRQTRYDIIW